MNKTIALLRTCLHDESGTTAMEYALIATVIAMIVLGAVTLTGNGLSSLFNSMANSANDTLTNSSNQLNG